jgi:hypothetical protein
LRSISLANLLESAQIAGMVTVTKLCIIWAHFNSASPAHDEEWFRVLGPTNCAIAEDAAEASREQMRGITFSVCPVIGYLRLSYPTCEQTPS